MFQADATSSTPFSKTEELKAQKIACLYCKGLKY